MVLLDPYELNPEIPDYFSSNRVKIDQFYDNERDLFAYLPLSSSTSVLDIGCACGGLGQVLSHNFSVFSYTGIELNTDACRIARTSLPSAEIINSAFGESIPSLINRQFDVVFSLSCIDWNTCFFESLTSSWAHVRPGGFLALSLRLTLEKTLNNASLSYQYINYSDELKGSKAPYVVININEFFDAVNLLSPHDIFISSYFKKPSITAVTPYKSILFTTIALQKPTELCDKDSSATLKVPKSVFDSFLQSSEN